MATPKPKSGGNTSGLPKMLAAGARQRGLQLLQDEMQVATGKNSAAFLRNALRIAKDKTAAVPQDYLATVRKLKQATGGRSLAALLEDGPIPARMPRIRGAPGADSAKPVVDSLPTEFAALAEAKVISNGVATPVITGAVHAAADRLGLSLKKLYQQLYPALERLRLKRRLKSRQGQRWSLDGRIAEIGLHNDPGVLAAEERAVQAALKQMGPPATRKPPPSPPPPNPKSPAARPRTVDEINAATELLEKIRRAPDVLDIELTDVRDSAGQLVTDRFRGLLDLRKEPPEFVIVAIGESKTAGGSADILPQLVQDVRRLLKGIHAPLSGRGTRVDFDRTRVRFGPELVVSWLSEKAPPASQVKNLEARLAGVFRQSRKTPPRIVAKPIDAGSTFQDARVVSGAIQTALQVLAAAKSAR